MRVALRSSGRPPLGRGLAALLLVAALAAAARAGEAASRRGRGSGDEDDDVNRLQLLPLGVVQQRAELNGELLPSQQSRQGRSQVHYQRFVWEGFSARRSDAAAASAPFDVPGFHAARWMLTAYPPCHPTRARRRRAVDQCTLETAPCTPECGEWLGLFLDAVGLARGSSVRMEFELQVRGAFTSKAYLFSDRFGQNFDAARLSSSWVPGWGRAQFVDGAELLKPAHGYLTFPAYPDTLVVDLLVYSISEYEPGASFNPFANAGGSQISWGAAGEEGSDLPLGFSAPRDSAGSTLMQPQPSKRRRRTLAHSEEDPLEPRGGGGAEPARALPWVLFAVAAVAALAAPAAALYARLASPRRSARDLVRHKMLKKQRQLDVAHPCQSGGNVNVPVGCAAKPPQGRLAGKGARPGKGGKPASSQHRARARQARDATPRSSSGSSPSDRAPANGTREEETAPTPAERGRDPRQRVVVRALAGLVCVLLPLPLVYYCGYSPWTPLARAGVERVVSSQAAELVLPAALLLTALALNLSRSRRGRVSAPGTEPAAPSAAAAATLAARRRVALGDVQIPPQVQEPEPRQQQQQQQVQAPSAAAWEKVPLSSPNTPLDTMDAFS